MSHPPATIAGMHYSPKLPARPCWHCTSFGGMTAQGTAALCNNRQCVRVRSNPQSGCVCWEREVGADDEPWHPEFARSAPWSPDDSTRNDDPLARPRPPRPLPPVQAVVVSAPVRRPPSPQRAALVAS